MRQVAWVIIFPSLDLLKRMLAGTVIQTSTHSAGFTQQPPAISLPFLLVRQGPSSRGRTSLGLTTQPMVQQASLSAESQLMGKGGLRAGPTQSSSLGTFCQAPPEAM